MNENIPGPEPLEEPKPWRVGGRLQKFYLTFGVQYAREEHPKWHGADPDGWVLIEAHSEPEARELAVAHFDHYWSMLYPGTHFPVEYNKQRFYPVGELAVLTAQGLTESVEPRRLRRVEGDE